MNKKLALQATGETSGGAFWTIQGQNDLRNGSISYI